MISKHKTKEKKNSVANNCISFLTETLQCSIKSTYQQTVTLVSAPENERSQFWHISSQNCGSFLHCLNQKHPCFVKRDVFIVRSNRMKRRERFVKKESRMSFVLNYSKVWSCNWSKNTFIWAEQIRQMRQMTVKPLWTPLLYLVLVRTEQFSEQRSKTMRGPKRFGQHSSLMQVFLQKSATRSAVRTISTVAR